MKGKKNIATVLSILVVTCSAFAQTVTLSTGLNPVGASTVTCGTLNVPIYGFSYNSTTFSNPVFTAINNWATSGTYTATDVLNFKLYRTDFSVFNTSNLLATVTTNLGPGTRSFPAFSYTISPSPVTRYFWITTDLSPTAVNGTTIICNVVTAAMTAITGTENFGTNNPGGTKTISCSVLPIELLSFTGKNTEAGNVLEWITASETNNDFFTLERSAEGVSFDPVVTVKGAGFSTEINRYTAVDDHPAAGEITYYRLLQTDHDGKSEYAGGIIVLYNDEWASAYIDFNPVDLKLEVYNLPAGAAYSVYTTMGQLAARGRLGEGNSDINVSGYDTGLYLVSVETGGRQIAGRFAITK